MIDTVKVLLALFVVCLLFAVGFLTWEIRQMNLRTEAEILEETSFTQEELTLAIYRQNKQIIELLKE